MKRYRVVIPFFVIMVLGIFLVAGTSLYGKNQLDEATNSANAEDGSDSTDTASFDPESYYQSTCSSCHGKNYEGKVGPTLLGVGKELSAEEIQEILTNGKGAMPKGLVPPENIGQMVEFVQTL